MPDLMARLAPYRCALLDLSALEPVGNPGSRVFTDLSLAWHDNPSSGLYTAVDDIVYDLLRKYPQYSIIVI